MEFTMLWWYWLIIGMLLIMAEIIVPTFTLFWFGLAALATGATLFFVPNLSLSLQLILWAASSVICTVLWFKYFKPTMVDRTKAGVSREAVTGESGIVIKAPQNDVRGVVRFAMPLLGADEWEFICHGSCEIGDRVEVTDVSGNTLIVRPKNS